MAAAANKSDARNKSANVLDPRPKRKPFIAAFNQKCGTFRGRCAHDFIRENGIQAKNGSGKVWFPAKISGSFGVL